MSEEESSGNDLEDFQKVLKRCRRKFVDDLDHDTLLDVFVEEDYITTTKDRDIRELPNTTYRNRKIMEIVRSRNVNGYIKFKVCLRKSHQEHLSEHLETVEVELTGSKIGRLCSDCDSWFENDDLLDQHTTSQEHLDVLERQQDCAEENVEESAEENSDLSEHPCSVSVENERDSNELSDKCSICDVTYTSPSHAKSHLSGKSHKKRKALLDMKSVSSISIAVSNESSFKSGPSNSMTKSNESRQVKGELENQPDCRMIATDITQYSRNNISSNIEQDKNRFCVICEVPFTGIENAKQHYEGDKHKKKVRLLEQEKKGEVFPLQCNICGGVKLSGQESAKAHFSSEKHKKKASQQKQQQESSNLYCNTCNCPFSGPENAAAHYESEKHKKKEKAKREDSKESLPSSCTLCNIAFSSDDHARQHFAGKKHKKAASRNRGNDSLNDNYCSQVDREDNVAQSDVITGSKNDDIYPPDTDVTNATEAENVDENDEDDITEDLERLHLGDTKNEEEVNKV